LFSLLSVVFIGIVLAGIGAFVAIGLIPVYLPTHGATSNQNTDTDTNNSNSIYIRKKLENVYLFIKNWKRHRFIWNIMWTMELFLLVILPQINEQVFTNRFEKKKRDFK